jgi:hypothetical protein
MHAAQNQIFGLVLALSRKTSALHHIRHDLSRRRRSPSPSAVLSSAAEPSHPDASPSKPRYVAILAPRLGRLANCAPLGHVTINQKPVNHHSGQLGCGAGRTTAWHFSLRPYARPQKHSKSRRRGNGENERKSQPHSGYMVRVVAMTDPSSATAAFRSSMEADVSVM